MYTIKKKSHLNPSDIPVWHLDKKQNVDDTSNDRHCGNGLCRSHHICCARF